MLEHLLAHEVVFHVTGIYNNFHKPSAYWTPRILDYVGRECFVILAHQEAASFRKTIL